MNWYKLLFWLAVIVIVIMFFRSCSCGGGNDTGEVVRIDTVKKQYNKDSSYVPNIKRVRDTIIIKGKPYPIHDTLDPLEVRIDPVDTAAILQQYYQIVEYEDVQPIQYGTITISDTVSQNRITGRRLQVNQTIPEITKTITKIDNRTVGYIGGSLLGNLRSPIFAAGVDFTLKLKNDRQYSLGVQYGRDNVMYYMGGVKLPVRLGKR